MSFFLVFLAIVLVGAVLWASLGLRPRRNGRQPLPAVLDGGFEQPPANLPPVLLPAAATPGDIDKVRFSLGLRGYRMDQVDQVLDDLRDQLAAARAEADRLRARIRDLEEGAASGAGEPEAPDGGTPPSGPDGQ